MSEWCFHVKFLLIIWITSVEHHQHHLLWFNYSLYCREGGSCTQIHCLFVFFRAEMGWKETVALLVLQDPLDLQAHLAILVLLGRFDLQFYIFAYKTLETLEMDNAFVCFFPNCFSLCLRLHMLKELMLYQYQDYKGLQELRWVCRSFQHRYWLQSSYLCSRTRYWSPIASVE